MTLLALAVVRLAWRAWQPPPPLPASVGGLQRRAAALGHGTLYAFLLALPLSGWLLSSAAAYSVSWFNLFAFPDLIAPGEGAEALLARIHSWLGEGLFWVALGHLAVALWHHFVDADGVLMRMLATAPVTVSVLGLIGVALLLGRTSAPVQPSRSVVASAAEAADVEDAAAAARPGSDLPRWDIDYSQSSIGFTGEQAGAPFDGRFGRWTADIRFDPQRLAESAARVEIDLASVSTGDEDRDGTLAEDSWFGGRRAVFTATRFSGVGEDANAFKALDARLGFGAAAPVPIEFEFSVRGTSDGWSLEGAARLNRLALGVGTGEWADPTWVGQWVDVRVSVHTGANVQP